MNKNTLLLLPIKNLNGKKFIIENYQRGYKWGKKEILEFLNDINEYDQTKGIYCIQPIILKPINEYSEQIEIGQEKYSIYKENEVIDGQQRTTSVYLILEYFRYLGLVDETIRYSIEYKIREKSGEFLSDKLTDLFKYLPIDIKEDLEARDYKELSEVHHYWSEFSVSNKEFNNVDIYHFFIACYYIKNWWSQYFSTDNEQKNTFVEKLLSHIHVIWYSLDDSIGDKGIINVFLNNNKGKIQLTNSELIKALFILDISNQESKAIAEYKVNRFALEWDFIEKKLQDDTFWYFIQPNKEKYNKGTRIDFLFDLRLENYIEDDTYAYRKYENQFNTLKNGKGAKFETEWSKIVQLCYKLIDWYNDLFAYHYIGYLTVTKISSLYKILELSIGKTKADFKQGLKDQIKSEFSCQVKRDKKEILKYHIDNLHYENFRKEAQNVILLYNVLYYVDKMSQHKFPFELYVKEKWSIEHLHPQNPKDIECFNQYKLWFADQLRYQDISNEALYIENDAINRLEKKSSWEEFKTDKELERDVNTIIETFTNKTHLISNLVLLDRNSNSSLSNKRYSEKRIAILDFDRDGMNDKKEKVFIPIETLNAFNKTFSKNIELMEWSNEDGEEYKLSIQNRLDFFLPKN